jgi:uncharacterized protein (DUF849 family)
MSADINYFPLSFCPTGMVPNKSDNPNVPITPREIVDCVREAVQLGITSVHIHARREDETPAWEKHYYEKIISGIRDFDEHLVLCVTTSGRDVSEFNKRSAVLELDGECKPDMGSLTLSSLNFARQASVNSPETVQALARKMLNLGIKPELEIFDLGMLNYVKYLQKKELITPPYVVNLLLGNVASMQADFAELGLAIDRLPENSIFLVAGIGEYQLKANIMGLLSNGGVRVGLEDNLFMDNKRQTLASNFELLNRIIKIAAQLERTPMSGEMFRSRFLN